MNRYTTEADLAGLLGATEKRVAEWRRTHGWPHLKVGRTVRYLPEHIEAIERMQTTRAKKPKQDDTFSGLTSRSRKSA